MERGWGLSLLEHFGREGLWSGHGYVVADEE